jgi:hypothetical protein
MMNLGYGILFFKTAQIKSSMQRKEQHNLEGQHSTNSTQTVS